MNTRLAFALLASTALGVATTSVEAADMRARAPVYKAPPVAAATWTGCYVGGNIGAGWLGGDASAQWSRPPLLVRRKDGCKFPAVDRRKPEKHYKERQFH